MADNNNPIVNAKDGVNDRINALIAEIGELVNNINNLDDPSEVSCVIAEQEVPGFIAKQSNLIDALIERDNNDDRDAQIAKLNEDLDKAQRNVKYYEDLWYKQTTVNKELKAAVKHLAAIILEA